VEVPGWAWFIVCMWRLLRLWQSYTDLNKALS